MAGPRARIEGAKELQAFLKKARKRGLDLRPVLRGGIDKSVSHFFKSQFDSAGGRGGSPWAPLSAATRKSRLRPGGNRGGLSRPLWDVGRLRASLVKVGPESHRVIERQRYERGTTVPSAQYHQTGTRRMPARQIVPDPLPSALVRSWLRFIEKYWMTGGVTAR